MVRTLATIGNRNGKARMSLGILDMAYRSALSQNVGVRKSNK